jgi:hypothetical protein
MYSYGDWHVLYLVAMYTSSTSSMETVDERERCISRQDAVCALCWLRAPYLPAMYSASGDCALYLVAMYTSR